MFEGSKDAKILFVSDFLRVQENAEGQILSGERHDLLINALNRAGIVASEYAFTVIHPTAPVGFQDVRRFDEATRHVHYSACKKEINESKANVIVPLGDYALQFITGLDSIMKHHCSILSVKAEFGQRKAIPLIHPELVQRAYTNIAYLSFGCMRLKEEMGSHAISLPERKFILSLDTSLDEQISYLEDVVLKADKLAIDIETGRGLINTVGFAVSPLQAIAIETEPFGKLADTSAFYKLWHTIGRVWESDIPKVAQNALYEFQWASKYGIRLNNIQFDTMWAMKFLHPELEKGLDNVGRIYTRFPYWKDDHSDWNNIRNWRQHLEYNCKDTTGTFEAYINQTKALEERKLTELFKYVMDFMPVIQEMCSRGFTLDVDMLNRMRADAERNIATFQERFDKECETRLGKKINTRSPKQMKELFKGIGIKLPIRKGKESTDKNALVKLRKKHPDELILSDLIEISKLNKQLSSYLNFKYDDDLHVRFTLDGCGTETGRWSSYTDPWGNGFNAQTVPKVVRNCIIASPGKTLIQLDLKQAESRFVAYEAPEPKLMEMLESGRDVHKYVAAQIFRKHEDMVNKTERQLGKKSGHSANYGVGGRTFAEACLTEMGIVLTDLEANRIIQGYYEVFPGIRKRQENIRKQIYSTRMMKTPLGRERVFYDRMGDSVFREAYAYTPQSTIPDITNHLMLFLHETFEDLEFLVQVHDSLLLQIDTGRENEIIEAARDYNAWHPVIDLPGGRLVIPIDAEIGHRWGGLKDA
jgi:DNA polymerase I-like protein with 3'-5' exonuclease and polymerase domains/uracil-DNA glycosylase